MTGCGKLGKPRDWRHVEMAHRRTWRNFGPNWWAWLRLANKGPAEPLSAALRHSFRPNSKPAYPWDPNAVRKPFRRSRNITRKRAWPNFLNIDQRAFGHVDIHQRPISRLLPGPPAGNAEVRAVALRIMTTDRQRRRRDNVFRARRRFFS